MKEKLKRWWFKQRTKLDLHFEYGSARNKTRMNKDLSNWMRRYDEGNRVFKTSLTKHDKLSICFDFGFRALIIVILMFALLHK